MVRSLGLGLNFSGTESVHKPNSKIWNQTGLWLFCLREFRTTLRELPAIAAAAKRGLTQLIIARGMEKVQSHLHVRLT